MANPNREKLTGLWAKEWVNPKGETIRFLSGKSDGVSYSIWPNGYKEKENDPTHVLFREVENQETKKPPSADQLPF